jgi:7,8-dihydro-6-hydroxymethylpterin-pyrophosphokinase
LKRGVLRLIESELGRVRSRESYAPRTIDLDLLLYGNLVIHDRELCIPDPDIRVRPFLAVPLLELKPDLVLPDTDEPLASVRSASDRRGMEPVPELTRILRGILDAKP